MITSTSYIRHRGPEVNTQTAISQKVRILSYLPKQDDSDPGSRNFHQIGAMSSFTVSENRPVEEIRGIGAGDRIIELIPGVTSTTLQATRAVLWLRNMMQSFGYRGGTSGLVRSLRQHRWPFDIRQEMVFSELATKLREENQGEETKRTEEGIEKSRSHGIEEDNDNLALITIYEGCWFESIGVQINSDSAIIQENCSIRVADVVASEGLKFNEEDYLQSNQKRAIRVREI